MLDGPFHWDDFFIQNFYDIFYYKPYSLHFCRFQIAINTVFQWEHHILQY